MRSSAPPWRWGSIPWSLRTRRRRGQRTWSLPSATPATTRGSRAPRRRAHRLARRAPPSPGEPPLARLRRRMPMGRALDGRSRSALGRRRAVPERLTGMRERAAFDHDRRFNLRAPTGREGRHPGGRHVLRPAGLAAASGIDAHVVPFGYHPVHAGPPQPVDDADATSTSSSSRPTRAACRRAARGACRGPGAPRSRLPRRGHRPRLVGRRPASAPRSGAGRPQRPSRAGQLHRDPDPSWSVPRAPSSSASRSTRRPRSCRGSTTSRPRRRSSQRPFQDVSPTGPGGSRWRRRSSASCRPADDGPLARGRPRTFRRDGATRILLVGAGRFAEDVTDIALDAGYEVAGWIEGLDPTRADPDHDPPIVWVDDQASPEPGARIVPAIGVRRRGRSSSASSARAGSWRRSSTRAPPSPAARSSSRGASSSRTSSSGHGHGSGPGRSSTAVSLVGHHTRIGSGCFLGPGANIAGGVTVGDDVYWRWAASSATIGRWAGRARRRGRGRRR